MTTELDPLEQAQLLDILREMLPHPVKEENLPEETTRLFGGEHSDVIVDVDPKTVTVSEYKIRIESDTARILRPLHLGTLAWGVLPAWTTRRILGELTAAAAAGRQAKYHECIRCKKEFPPEEMSSETTCKSCAATEEGVVY